MAVTLWLNAHEQRRVAVAAACDPRSVRAFLEGRAMRPTCVARIARALDELDLDRFVRRDASTSTPVGMDASPPSEPRS